MKKISIKDIVKFRHKSDRAKKSFAVDIQFDKEKKKSGDGGNYWAICLSAISNSYESNDVQCIIDKQDEFFQKYEEEEYPRTKQMYKRNLDILKRYENFDFKKWRPSSTLRTLRKGKDFTPLTVRDLQIQIIPHYVFSFQKNGVEEVGAIWFIAQREGFRKEELGMFTDVLYRYVKKHYSKYPLNTKYCIVVDVVNNLAVNYSQLEKKEVPAILNSTIDEIKKLM